MRTLARHTSTRLALVLATAAAMLTVIATPALASDVVIRGLDAVCADDSDGIAYSVTTDRQGEAAEHPAIRVEWKPAGLDDDAYATLGTGPLTPENGYTYSDVVTGLDFGDATNVTVRATALKFKDGGGPWGDGRPAGDTYTRTISVEECNDGDPGENARMNFTAGCTTAAGEPAVILFNDGTPGEDEALTFDVEAGFDGHVLTDQVTLEPGDQTTVLLVFTDGDDQVDTEDGTIEVRVTVADTVLERTIDVDCEGDPEPQLDASVRAGCTPDGGVVTATLDNPTEAAATFVVTIDGTVVDEVELAAGESTERSYPVADGDHTATVESDNRELADAQLTTECAPSPAVEVSSECFEDVATIELLLTNPDPSPATFEVLLDGELVETVEVVGGGTPVSLPVVAGAHDVVVVVDGVTIYDETVNALCTADVFSDVQVDVVCSADGGRILVTVDNPDDATTAQVTVDGALAADVDVPSLDITEIEVLDVVDGPREVVVVLGGSVAADEVVDVDCTEVLGVTDSRDPDPEPDAAPTTEVLGEQLPAAGAESILWVLAALLLLFLGGDMVLSELTARLRRGGR